MTAEIILGKKHVTRDSMPYIIAEIGVNHEGKLSQALELIDLAKEGGADAAKFQTYKAEKLASKYSPAYWDTKKEPTLSQFELFKKYDSFTEKDYKKLANHCEDINIDFNEGILKIKGPKGELNRTIPTDVQLDITDDKILVKRSSDVNKVKALHGLTRSLINNMIIGVTDGFEKALEIKGTGYKCDIIG